MALGVDLGLNLSSSQYDVFASLELDVASLDGGQAVCLGAGAVDAAAVDGGGLQQDVATGFEGDEAVGLTRHTLASFVQANALDAAADVVDVARGGQVDLVADQLAAVVDGLSA